MRYCDLEPGTTLIMGDHSVETLVRKIDKRFTWFDLLRGDTFTCSFNNVTEIGSDTIVLEPR